MSIPVTIPLKTSKITIGVLALQGAFAEHLEQIKRLLYVEAVPVRTTTQLNTVDALILPGGESTAMGRLMVREGLYDAIRQRIETGMPVWGTCAGMILLAADVDGEAPHLGVLNARVMRNAYGTQLDSFRAIGRWSLQQSTPAEMVYIRAPRFESWNEPARPAAWLDAQVTGLVQGHILATAFHPELIGDLTPYNWLIEQVKMVNHVPCDAANS
jgi:5'-phosphate synthase pdxT subunit